MSLLRWIALGAVLAAPACGYPTFSYGNAPPACALLGNDCPDGQKCAVGDETSGAVGCVPLDASLRDTYGSCTQDSECRAGEWCEHRTHVCKPMCGSGSDCSSGGACVAGLTPNGDKIPGLGACVADCEPKAATPCGQGATCDYDASPAVGALDCFKTGDKAPGDTCTAQPECAPGLVCALGACTPWCSSNGECANGCFKFDSFTPMYMGTEYGFCD